jgi:geranylgeranyl pyrophosphate synthase
MKLPLNEWVNQTAEWISTKRIFQDWPACQHVCLERLSADLPQLVSLPFLSCQAVGGNETEVIPVVASWSMLRYAANFIDAVQDGDNLPEGVRDSGAAIGYANGLIFAAFDSIAAIRDRNIAIQMIALFSQTAFQASLGNHLSQQRKGTGKTTLETYWHATILKSGSIFRAGLGGGAMAGNAPDQYIAALDDFGNALGIIRQIIDDCRDVLEKTKTGAYEVTLPLLMLAHRREESVVELMANFNSREALSAAFNESNVPEMITSILLEWHRRALEALQILDRNEAVIALEGILTDFVTTPWWNLVHE